MSDPGVLVLCEPTDSAALWAANGLRRRVPGPVEVVTGALLGSALSWEHRLRDDRAEVEIVLADGRRISSARPRPVLNRLLFLPTERLDIVGGPDREYAVQEFQALFLSWLSALPGPMLNRPSPQFLGGQWRHPSRWAVLAAEAGLVTAPYRQSSEDPPGPPSVLPPTAWGPAQVTVFAVGGQIVGPPHVPAPALDGCRRLAKAVGDELLGIDLAPTPRGDWRFVTATATPDLTRGGEPLLDALAASLRLP